MHIYLIPYSVTPTGGYSLSEPSEHFSLDNTTGVVTVKARLDYETQPELSLVVVAHDTGVPPLSASATIVVQVMRVLCIPHAETMPCRA